MPKQKRFDDCIVESQRFVLNLQANNSNLFIQFFIPL